MKELSTQLSKMSGKEMDDNKHYHEIQRLSMKYSAINSYRKDLFTESCQGHAGKNRFLQIEQWKEFD